MSDQFPGVVLWFKFSDRNMLKKYTCEICEDLQMDKRYLMPLIADGVPIRCNGCILEARVELTIRFQYGHWRFEILEEEMNYDEKFIHDLSNYLFNKLDCHNIVYGVGLHPNSCKWLFHKKQIN